ncbi:MAG: hypothetical protein ACYDCQ_16575 [Dehalococcoidia bacterium]
MPERLLNQALPKRCYTWAVRYGLRRLKRSVFHGRAVLWLSGLVLTVVACSSAHGSPVKMLAPVLLAQLALAPADLDAAYVVDQEGYRDQDGRAASSPTSQYVRQLRLNLPAPADKPATRIIVSVDDLGMNSASDFIDAADDQTVGPPNLDDYIMAQIPGAHDVHTELIEDFPSYDDDTVANRLTWQQTVNGTEETWRSYGVYVRSGGLLAFVALRAPEDQNGAEPEGLLKQAMATTKKQADKLKYGNPTVLTPRP